MDSLIAAQKKWERLNGLEKTIDDVQRMIDLITKTKHEIVDGGSSAALALAKMKNPVKESFERLNKDAKDLHSSITNYGKLLDKTFKPMRMTESSVTGFPTNAHLTNRAVGMHLLREGMFDVASAFVEEVSNLEGRPAEEFWELHPRKTPKNTPRCYESDEDEAMEEDPDEMEQDDDQDDDSEHDGTHSQHRHEDLQLRFVEMYAILRALRHDHTLDPAIAWAKEHSDVLEARGSNLEFELCRLRFVEHFESAPELALEYARSTFPLLSRRYFRETARLLGALAYSPSVKDSPYRSLFIDPESWEQVAVSFTREFCGLLGLSEASPLYTAVTAGGIALPVLEKWERVMGQVGGQWTSANEMPVEIPLPPSYSFHSIFVCPVSKEQATDTNPPMMMACGHVICKDSMTELSRGTKKLKCPYCPEQSHPRDAKKVFL